MTQADERAGRIYAFIIRHKRAHDGNSPTMQQIGDACGISSVSMVTVYLDRLEADGKIARVHRRIHVEGGMWRLNEIDTAQRTTIEELTEALRQQAGNYHLAGEALCWCRHWDWTINPQCEDQGQCILARCTIERARSALSCPDDANIHDRQRRPTPPGRIIQHELDARGWTQKYLSELIGRRPATINRIIKGTKQIMPRMAIQLGRAFGTSAELWWNLECRYRLWEAYEQAAMP